MPVDDNDRIVRDRLTARGDAVIRGTRVTLRTVLASLAEGATVEEVLKDFPSLTSNDVRAAVCCSAWEKLRWSV